MKYNPSNSSIAKASFTVLIMTLFTKIIGFIETAVMAAYFGTSAEIDMFFLANSICNKMVFTFFSGLSVVGVTMYNSAVQREGKNGGDKFASALFLCIIPISIIVGALIFIFAPTLSSLVASNYSSFEISILTNYVRQLSLISLFYPIMTILQAILSANKKFIPGTLTGVLQNIVLIIFIVSLSESFGVSSLVIGFIASYVVQVLFIYICARKVFRPTRFSLSEDIDCRKILIIIMPLVLGEATGELNTLIDQYLASGLGEGYISALSYAESLDSVVTALFIQTITSVLLAFFSKLAVEEKYEEMFAELKKIFKTMTLVLIPITIVTATSADKIVSFLYERGTFNSESAKKTAIALMGYGFGFVFKTIMVISKRPFFAVGNTKVPMIIGVVSVVINISLSIFLSNIWGIFGITVATSFSYFIASIIYYGCFRKYFPDISWAEFKLFLFKVGLATIVSVLSVMVIRNLIYDISSFFYLMLVSIGCFIVYLAVLKLLKVEELEYGTKMLKKKLRTN